ncbi:MAG: glycosyltransferase family 4 protein [Halomonas sp.]|nr:glycosyltransferase family 4 protein [Halomonas sp.]MBR2515248.1 glycosyltransferase family 4 protein [Halomonas sp.]
MKIIIFVDSLTSGGAERVSVFLSEYLIAQGHSVAIVTVHSEHRDFYHLSGRVKRYSLNLTKTNRGIGKFFYNIKRVRSLRKIINLEKADVVIGMMTMCSVLSIVSCFGLSTHSITAERNYPGRKPAIKPWGLLRRVFYLFADAHIVQSIKTAAWLKKNTGAHNTFIIPNAVSWPLANFSPIISPQSLVDVNTKLILAIGTKPYQKGFDLLLEAFALVTDRPCDWKLAIIGLDITYTDNDDVNALLALASRLGISQNIIWPGRIGNVGDWYERADMFVLSSRYEGFPNVLLEAMAAGCPSVAFDCDTGPRDIIRHGENGLLVENERSDKLAGAMLSIIENKSLRERLSTSAVDVRVDFAEDKIFSEWERVINEVL